MAEQQIEHKQLPKFDGDYFECAYIHTWLYCRDYISMVLGLLKA